MGHATVWRLLSACLAVVVLTAQSALAEDAALNAIRAINPLGELRELAPADWRVSENTSPTARTTHKVATARILQTGDLYYVAEQDSDRWLVGSVHVEPYRPARDIQVFQTFATLDELRGASDYPPLPNGKGLRVREMVRFGKRPQMLSSQGDGHDLYVLFVDGDVWRIDRQTGRHTQILRSSEYLDPARGAIVLGGLAVGPDGRLFIIINQQTFRSLPISNEVTIYRTTRMVDGKPAVPQVWMREKHPWGLATFAFGVGRPRFGPDGMLYIASGARTDAGEVGTGSGYSRAGEHALTSCLWRIDPTAADPKVTVFAHGLRLCGGFDWSATGDLLATDTNPSSDRPDELNLLRENGHYGFPYFLAGDTTASAIASVASTMPSNGLFWPPLANVGPAGGGSSVEPLHTLDAHSRPWDVAYVGRRLKSPWTDSFFVTRLGNQQPQPTNVGFDVLCVRLRPRGAETIAEVEPFLTQLARPIDVVIDSPDKVYILEQSRALAPNLYTDSLPGRLLEVTVGK